MNQNCDRPKLSPASLEAVQERTRLQKHPLSRHYPDAWTKAILSACYYASEFSPVGDFCLPTVRLAEMLARLRIPTPTKGALAAVEVGRTLDALVMDRIIVRRSARCGNRAAVYRWVGVLPHPQHSPQGSPRP